MKLEVNFWQFPSHSWAFLRLRFNLLSFFFFHFFIFTCDTMASQPRVVPLSQKTDIFAFKKQKFGNFFDLSEIQSEVEGV